MTRLILASQSPARLQVLRTAGLSPEVRVSEVDEDALTDQLGDIAPAELAHVLAMAKARDVARHFAGDDALVIGCDSVFEIDGQAFGKPLTPDIAIERISQMSGRTGLLHTGHCVIRGEHAAARTTTTIVHFATMTLDDIAAYVATGEPLNVAGSFTLDGRAGAYITGIEGDPSNVIGISLPTVRELATELGISWPDLWSTEAGA